jgi:putative transcriptional regulator
VIQHHLDDALLLEYTSGAATPPRALVAASHLTLCPACRDRQASYDAVGGALLDRSAPAPVEGLLAATLARLDEPTPGGLATDPDGVLPGPLAAIVGRFSALPWRRTFPFVEEVAVDQGFGGFPARLFRLTPGTFVPRHEHAGDELSLVLAGGFSDDRGHHGRGDLSVRVADELHRQSIDWGEPCIVLVAADAPFRPRSLIARLASRFGKF